MLPLEFSRTLQFLNSFLQRFTHDGSTKLCHQICELELLKPVEIIKKPWQYSVFYIYHGKYQSIETKQ
jgi:hypothetical protein